MKLIDSEENDCGDLENMPLMNKINSNSFEENFEFGMRFEFYRQINILTLILLISSYTLVWFFSSIIIILKLFLHFLNLEFITFD